jgi:hypothetical protein
VQDLGAASSVIDIQTDCLIQNWRVCAIARHCLLQSKSRHEQLFLPHDETEPQFILRRRAHLQHLKR